MPDATDTTRTFNAIAFDTDGMADLVNERLIANTPGIYLVVGSVAYAANAVGRRNTLIYQNGFYGLGTGTNIGSNSQQALTEAGARTTAQAITLQRLEAGDFVSGGTFQSSGGALTEGGAGTGSGSFLSAARVGD